MTTIRAYLVDIKYKIERNITVLLICRDENGKLITIRDYYRPSFLILPHKDVSMISLRAKLSKIKFDDKNFITSTEMVTKKINNSAENLIKVHTSRPETAKYIKDTILKWDDVINIFEDDISLTRKYLIENNITPFSLFEAEVVEHSTEQYFKLVNFLNRDLLFSEPETLSVNAVVDDFDKKTILAISCCCNDESLILTNKSISTELDYIVTTTNEEDLLSRFRSFVIRKKPDILIFNDPSFGLKQIMERGIHYNIDMNMNIDGSNPYINKITRRYRTIGINEIFITRILDNFFSKNKNIDNHSPNKNKDKGKNVQNDFQKNITIGSLIEEKDINDNLINQTFKKSQLNLMIFNSIYNNLTEIMKFTNLRFADMFNFSINSLIEWILINQSIKKNHIVLNKDADTFVNTEKRNKIEVMDTLPGIYDNIVILDLLSIYPEIIIKNNISPETLKYSQKERIEQEEAILPKTLNIIGDRIERLKKAIENVPNENLERRHDILENLFYGFYSYLTNKRMRWSSEEIISLIITNTKNSITNIINHINEKNSVIYSDFNEMFIQAKEKPEEILKNLKQKIAESRNITIKQISKRGFLLPKLESFNLQKRLAVLNDTKTFTARNLLRQSQPIFVQDCIKATIKMVLTNQSKEKIIKTIQEKIKLLDDGKISKEEISTNITLNRNIASYHKNTIQGNIISRVISIGEEIKKGDKISFIITKGEGAPSKRAKLTYEVEDSEYDPEYYIKKLLIPAIEDILILRGINTEEIVKEGKQEKLDEF